MKRLGWCLLLWCWAWVAGAVTVTDDRGVAVTLAQPPQRIVTLLPSLAETVCALGQCERLVGVDRYTTYPESLRQLPKVGGGLDPNIESVVALRPDVVLMSLSSRAVDRLESLGIKVLALETKTYDDMHSVLDRLGVLLGVEDAQRVWSTIESGVAEVARALPPQAQALQLYFEVNQGPYAAGQSSFIGETMQRLGVGNVVAPELGAFPKLNPEYIVRANPDVIVVGRRSYAGMEQRPGWRLIRAVREGRICVLSDAEMDVAIRPGPRMVEGAQLLADCVRSKGLEAQ